MSSKTYLDAITLNLQVMTRAVDHARSGNVDDRALWSILEDHIQQIATTVLEADLALYEEHIEAGPDDGLHEPDYLQDAHP